MTSRIDARLAHLGGGLQIVDALGAARGQAVLVDVGALAEAVFSDGEDERFADAELFVQFLQSLFGIIATFFRGLDRGLQSLICL